MGFWVRLHDMQSGYMTSGYMSQATWVRLHESGYMSRATWVELHKSARATWVRLHESGNLSQATWVRLHESGYMSQAHESGYIVRMHESGYSHSNETNRLLILCYIDTGNGKLGTNESAQEQPGIPSTVVEQQSVPRSIGLVGGVSFIVGGIIGGFELAPHQIPMTSCGEISPIFSRSSCTEIIFLINYIFNLKCRRVFQNYVQVNTHSAPHVIGSIQWLHSQNQNMHFLICCPTTPLQTTCMHVVPIWRIIVCGICTNSLTISWISKYSCIHS